jgi:hypothetical protein
LAIGKNSLSGFAGPPNPRLFVDPIHRRGPRLQDRSKGGDRLIGDTAFRGDHQCEVIVIIGLGHPLGDETCCGQECFGPQDLNRSSKMLATGTVDKLLPHAHLDVTVGDSHRLAGSTGT